MHDRIWFTYKARIQAYHRLEWLDTHTQFLLIWYAILSAALAVVTIRYPRVLGDDTDIIATILSVVLLGLSLAVSNRDFRWRAENMRKNYIALQFLYNTLTKNQRPTKKLVKKYDELLSSVENHKEIDDKIFRVKNKSRLNSRKPNYREYMLVYSWIFIRYLVIFFLYWPIYYNVDFFMNAARSFKKHFRTRNLKKIYTEK